MSLCHATPIGSAATSPLQQQPRRRHSQRGAVQKDNCQLSQSVGPCSSGLSPAEAPMETPFKAPFLSNGVSPATPTKIAAARSPGKENLSQKQSWGYEVKNTFIHYGSPLRTVSVVTPPKTVPSDFRPEVLFLEPQNARLRTPVAVYHHTAATPSTAGCSLLTGGRDFCGQPQTANVFLAPPPSAPPAVAPLPNCGGAPTSTLLLLSDFLPAPSAGPPCIMAATIGGVGAQVGVQALSGDSCIWQQAPVETMPMVPPLPGQMGQALVPPPPPPPPPQFAAYVPNASYEPMHFITGEAPPMMPGASMPVGSMLPPQLPPQHQPTLPVMEQTQSYQLCNQFGASPLASMGGPSPTSSGMFCMPPPTMSVVSPMNSTQIGGMVSATPSSGSVMMDACLGPFCMPNNTGTCGIGTLGAGPATSMGYVSSTSGHNPVTSMGYASSCNGGGVTVSISASMFPEQGASCNAQYAQGMLPQQHPDMSARWHAMPINDDPSTRFGGEGADIVWS